MKHKRLMGLVATGMILPSLAIAGKSVLAEEIEIQTANVEAISSKDGRVVVRAGDTVVSLPSRKVQPRLWVPFRSWRLPWRNWQRHSSHCRHSSSQTTQNTSEGIVQRSSSHQICN